MKDDFYAGMHDLAEIGMEGQGMWCTKSAPAQANGGEDKEVQHSRSHSAPEQIKFAEPSGMGRALEEQPGAGLSSCLSTQALRMQGAAAAELCNALRQSEQLCNGHASTSAAEEPAPHGSPIAWGMPAAAATSEDEQAETSRQTRLARLLLARGKVWWPSYFL
jgi:hypothetical protein